MPARFVGSVGRALYRWCWRLAIALLVVLALYASLGRYYIEYLPRYAQQLVTYVRDNSDMELRMTALDGSWSGLSPVISLNSLELHHNEQMAARLTAVRGKLGVISGLILHQGIDVVELRAKQLELHLRQSEQGEWQFAGSPLAGDKQGNFDLTGLLLGIREADLRELTVTLHYANGEEARLWGQKLRLAGDSQFRRLKATLGIAESSPTRLIAELEGDPRSDDFQLNAYVQLEDSSFTSVAPLFGAYETVAGIEGSGELWLSVNGRDSAQWHGRVDIPQLAVGSLWDSEQQLSDASLVFGGVFGDRVARTWFSELEFYWQNQYVDWSGLQVSMRADADGRLSVVLPNLDLGMTQARLLNSGALPAELDEVLGKMAPQGLLRNLKVDVPLDNPRNFHIAADVSSLVLESVNNAPGVRGLDGYVELGADAGELSIAAAAIQLALPSVYDQPLRLQDLATRLQWSIADERLQLRSSQIRAHDGDSVISGRLGLDIALTADAPKPSSISLLVGLRDGSVKQRDHYLPAVVGDGLRDWLDSAILQGQVPQAAFLLHGALREGEQRTIQLALDATDIALDYHPDWPALNRASASLLLNGDTVDVSSESAYIYDDIALRDVQVGIRSPDDTVILSISAEAKSSLNSALRVVRESALRKQVGGSFDDWHGKGSVQAQIDLDIPLQEGAEPRARIDTHISGSELVLDNLNLTIADVEGPLLFDSQQGLSAPAISGAVFGRPIAARVVQTLGNPVQVNVQGRVDIADVRNWLNQPLLGFAHGEADINIDMTVGQDSTYFKASSDLFDVAIDLPEPLGKPAQQSRLFELGIPLSLKPLTLDLSVDGLGRLMLAFDESSQLSGGSFALGGSSIPPPPRGWFMVVGKMEETKLDDWIAVLDQYQTLVARQADGRVKREVSDDAMAIVVEDFSIKRLQGLGRTWQDVEIDASNGAGTSTWQLAMRSRRLEGTLRLAPDMPMKIDLQRFNLPELPTLDIAAASPANPEPDAMPERSAELADPRSMLEKLNPSSFPAVDFSAENLAIADAPLGSIAFALRPTATGAEFSGIRGNLRGLQLGLPEQPVTLQWHQSADGNSSILKGPVSVANIGDVLQNWQFERVMESRSGRADLDVNWAAAPDMLSPRVLSGSMGMRFEKGRFLRGSDAASGTLRMVGLLNFANIIRRLQFNFSDIFEKGIHYDRIRGNMQFVDGVMRMPKPIEIDGPSSTFRISGMLDFNTDLTDMELQATLPVGSNLPWVAALISGLPVAAGVYIASKLFEEQVDKVSSLVYRVHGPWQQPELEFKRLFGDAVSIESPQSTEPDGAKPRGGEKPRGGRSGMGRGVPGK
ncbi:MAG TPA: TIGR02099 family protein [Spongiibacteraceae bacterium]|nr:TIGR02099 family protein [Spongiibacteraceae bacterium]HCS26597.1 TIGR02099 family protein [Spongiibacteraceae bacterium]